jgi:hypothetical protein
VTKEKILLQIPRVKLDRGREEVFNYEAEQDNGIIVPLKEKTTGTLKKKLSFHQKVLEVLKKLMHLFDSSLL